MTKTNYTLIMIWKVYCYMNLFLKTNYNKFCWLFLGQKFIFKTGTRYCLLYLNYYSDAGSLWWCMAWQDKLTQASANLTAFQCTGCQIILAWYAFIAYKWSQLQGFPIISTRSAVSRAPIGQGIWDTRHVYAYICNLETDITAFWLRIYMA